MPRRGQLSVKAPRQKLGKGKTPVLTAEEAGELLRSIETDNVVGLRDRALIGVMVFTFARVSAACGLNVADIFHQQRRLWVRLHEKGGKFHEMPCHHTLEGYLAEYLERAQLADAGRVPLFQAIKYRPYGRGEAHQKSHPILMKGCVVPSRSQSMSREQYNSTKKFLMNTVG